jgi:hypothetical protein
MTQGVFYLYFLNDSLRIVEWKLIYLLFEFSWEIIVQHPLKDAVSSLIQAPKISSLFKQHQRCKVINWNRDLKRGKSLLQLIEHCLKQSQHFCAIYFLLLCFTIKSEFFAAKLQVFTTYLLTRHLLVIRLQWVHVCVCVCERERERE